MTFAARTHLKALPLHSWASSVSTPFTVAYCSSTGTFSAALRMGGTNASPSQYNVVGGWTFNGTAWSQNTSSSFPGGQGGGLCGTTTDAIWVAGEIWNGSSTGASSNVYRLNGTTFTNVTASPYPSANDSGSAVGSGFNDARVIGGTASTTSQTFNGTTWATSGALSSSYRIINLNSAGSSSSALIMGGIAKDASTYGTPQSACEKNSGATFSSAGSLPSALYSGAGAGTSSSAAMLFGGNAAATGSGAVTPVSTTYSGNGTAFTTLANMVTARAYNGGCGTTTLGFTFGGATSSSTILSSSEKYT